MDRWFGAPADDRRVGKDHTAYKWLLQRFLGHLPILNFKRSRVCIVLDLVNQTLVMLPLAALWLNNPLGLRLDWLVLTVNRSLRVG